MNSANKGKRVAIFRKEGFNAAHRIYNPEWNDEKNYEVFGKCANPNYHGHNYDLIVKLTGEIDPDTGYVFDLKVLSTIMKHEVLDVLDHKNLNLDIEELKSVFPSAENIAIFIYEKLRAKIDQKYDLLIRLYESEKNFVEYPVV